MKYELKAKVGTIPKVIIYKRVSDPRMSLDGHSIEVQDEQLNRLAEGNGWQVLQVFKDDGKSARNLDRKDMQEFLDYCDEHRDIIDGALIQDTSRLCRNVQDHLMVKAFLRKRNIKIIPLDGFADDGSPEGDFIDLIVAGVNELESKRTGKKTKRIMVAMAEKGFKPGQAPLGYINSFRKGSPMTVDTSYRFFFKEMFRLWNTSSYSLQQVSDMLFEQGFRSRNGKKVEKSAVESYLKNIVYAGGLKYDGVVYETAQHEGIISMEEYIRAKEVFKMRNKGADRTRKHITLLAGMVHCFSCGGLMYGEYHPDANYYRCKNCKKSYANMQEVDGCISIFFNGTTFMQEALDALRKELIEVKRAQGNSLPAQRRALNNRKNALDVKMSSLEDKLLYGDSTIDKNRLKQKYEPLKLELKKVEEQLKNLDKPSKNLKDSEIEKVIEGMRRLTALYDGFTLIQKKQFIKFFIKKVFVDTESNKIVQYELVPEFEALVSGDLVRISSSWLPRLDSNQ